MCVVVGLTSVGLVVHWFLWEIGGGVYIYNIMITILFLFIRFLASDVHRRREKRTFYRYTHLHRRRRWLAGKTAKHYIILRNHRPIAAEIKSPSSACRVILPRSYETLNLRTNTTDKQTRQIAPSSRARLYTYRKIFYNNIKYIQSPNR